MQWCFFKYFFIDDNPYFYYTAFLSRFQEYQLYTNRYYYYFNKPARKTRAKVFIDLYNIKFWSVIKTWRMDWKTGGIFKIARTWTWQQANMYIGQIYLSGKFGGWRKRMRPRAKWYYNITEWTGKNMMEAGKATVDICKWRKNVIKSSMVLQQSEMELKKKKNNIKEL